MFTDLFFLVSVGIQFTIISRSVDIICSAAENLNMNSSVKLTRILCLHGYGQNANIFKSKIGGLRRLLKKEVEFSFLDAPHIVKKCEENDQVERAWYLRKSDGNWDPKGLEESLKYCDEYCTKNGPFDGLLGFSQGVDIATILCTLPAYSFKFVILISGCKSSMPEYSTYYENEIRIPSLHIFGATDTIIVQKRSEELRDCFCQTLTETINHEGGHHVPLNKDIKHRYVAFIEKYAGNTLES